MSIGLLGERESQLLAALDVAAARHRLIASNIANIDTPGYKARHVEFSEALRLISETETAAGQAGRDASRFQLATLDPVITVDQQARRPDGNSVNVEREMADLVDNATLYATVAQALGKHYQRLRAAINEGRQ